MEKKNLYYQKELTLVWIRTDFEAQFVFFQEEKFQYAFFLNFLFSHKETVPGLWRSFIPFPEPLLFLH